MGQWKGDPELIKLIRQAGEREASLRARWPRKATGELDGPAAMSMLGSLFRVLAGARGLEPWAVETFVEWLCTESHRDDDALYAGRFLLHVWDPEADWAVYARERGWANAGRLEPFDAMTAARVWSAETRLAFLVWFEAPFWA